MADQRKGGISWTDETWNPITGCTKLSPGCRFCYAERLAPRFQKQEPFSTVKIHPYRLEIPLDWTRPRKVFVCSVSDIAHEKVPEDFIRRVFSVMIKAHWHTFQVLTKRIGRLRELWTDYLNDRKIWPAPPHIWLGVSCENQEWANKRIPVLLQTPAAVRWVSLEPLLDPIQLTGICSVPACFNSLLPGRYPKLDWVVVGGESGPECRPIELRWSKSILAQCKDARVPFFMKQVGGHPNKRANLQDLPPDLRVREFPISERR